MMELAAGTCNKLNESHQKKYLKYLKLLQDMDAHTDYHQYFLRKIRKKISALGE